jgi:hypothetical protein
VKHGSVTDDAFEYLSPTRIRVVTIAPGTILTPAYGKAGDQLEAYWGPQVPHPKRMGRPGESAALVQAIAENDYLNGEVIRLDDASAFPRSNASPLGAAPAGRPILFRGTLIAVIWWKALALGVIPPTAG